MVQTYHANLFHSAPASLAGRSDRPADRSWRSLGRRLVLRLRRSRTHHRRLEGARGAGRAGLHLRDADDRRLSVRHRVALRRCRRRIQVEPAAARAQGQGHAGLGPCLAADRADHRIRRPADDRRAGPAGDDPGELASRADQGARPADLAGKRLDRGRAAGGRSRGRRKPVQGGPSRPQRPSRLRHGAGQSGDRDGAQACRRLRAVLASGRGDAGECRHHRGAARPEGFCAEALAAALPRTAGRRRPHRDHQRARAAARHHRGGERRRSACLPPAGSTASFA